MLIKQVLTDIVHERIRQLNLRLEGKHSWTYDDDVSDERRLSALGEEYGEVSREVCDAVEAGEVRLPNLRAELIQVAAACTAWVELIDLESGRCTLDGYEDNRFNAALAGFQHVYSILRPRVSRGCEEVLPSAKGIKEIIAEAVKTDVPTGRQDTFDDGFGAALEVVNRALENL